jgi:serine/threonine-protein kinase
MLHCPKCGRQYSAEFQFCPEDESPLQADSTLGAATVVDPLVGHTLDEKYRLEEKLGIGGMGTVYRARHLLIDRPVAVKVLNQRFVEDEAARTRFRREARAAGRLQHANAVTVTDFGESHDGYVYLVMELLEGRTLRDVLAKEAPLDVARSVSLMLQIAGAVAAAHEAGIIHRDLKPANIFIVQRADVPAVVKVLDFGIAKLAAESLDDDEAMTLTQVGAMIGTPRYMSPEQCDGLDLTPAADVYSLGCILYEMLTGTVPFSGSTPLAIAMKQISDTPRSPREFVSTIPVPLEKVVLHTLEKRPENRPANAAEFSKELLETAERLGFEHASITSSPNLAALRSVGTESPSGRLVIDISRLRETRANSENENELTVIRPASVAASAAQPAIQQATQPREQFPRISLPLGVGSNKRKLFAIIAVAAVLLIAVGMIAQRFRQAAPEAATVASPTPTETPTPSPSPSPVAQAKAPVKKPTPAPKKKGNAIFNKMKKIFKNPF